MVLRSSFRRLSLGCKQAQVRMKVKVVSQKIETWVKVKVVSKKIETWVKVEDPH